MARFWRQPVGPLPPTPDPSRWGAARAAAGGVRRQETEFRSFCTLREGMASRSGGAGRKIFAPCEEFAGLWHRFHRLNDDEFLPQGTQGTAEDGGRCARRESGVTAAAAAGVRIWELGVGRSRLATLPNGVGPTGHRDFGIHALTAGEDDGITIPARPG